MKAGQVFKIILMVFIVFFLLIGLSDVFETDNGLSNRNLLKFYSLKRNTLDGVFIGSSAVHCYWIASQAYDDYGMTVYPVASNALPAWMFVPVIKEIRKTQDPKLFVLDVRPFTAPYEGKWEKALSYSRLEIDAMKFFSPNRIDAISRTVRVCNQAEEGFIDDHGLSLFFTVLRDHSKWDGNNFSINKTTFNPSAYLGFYMVRNNSLKVFDEMAVPERTGKSIELPWYNDMYLREVLEYARDNGLELLFVNDPNLMKEEEEMRVNKVFEILNEYGVDYVDYSTAEVMENYHDLKKDFMNDGHVNYYGAVKFTRYFSEYLHENYDLADHRDDPRVKDDWDGVTKRIKRKIKQWKEEAEAS